MVKLLWAIQSKCNFNCKHCYFSISNRRVNQDLKQEDLVNLAKKFLAQGVSEVYLSGGEPLIRLYVYKLIAQMRNCGIQVILTTNASTLTKANCVKLLNSGVNGVLVSLDSHIKEKNNLLREQFDLVVNNTKNLVNLKKEMNSSSRIGICCVVNHYTVMNLVKTAEFAIDLGVDYFTFQPIWLPKGHALEDFALTAKDYIVLNEEIAELRHLSSKIILPNETYLKMLSQELVKNETLHVNFCPAGSDFKFLDETGTIKPCPSYYKKDSIPGTQGCDAFSTDCVVVWEMINSKFLK